MVRCKRYVILRFNQQNMYKKVGIDMISISVFVCPVCPKFESKHEVESSFLFRCLRSFVYEAWIIPKSIIINFKSFGHSGHKHFYRIFIEIHENKINERESSRWKNWVKQFVAVLSKRRVQWLKCLFISMK